MVASLAVERLAKLRLQVPKLNAADGLEAIGFNA
jgi:hypothetical protein